LACMSSGTVGAWMIWNDPKNYPYGVIVWKLLSAASALLSIALPILNFTKKISAASRLKWEYSALQAEYDVLWLKLSLLSNVQAINEFSKISKRESELTKMEDNLPTNDEKLIRKCQTEVITSRGLTKK
jgi:hypothetical protein